MKRYLGEVWVKNVPKKKTWWRKEGKVIVHKFTERIIEAENYLEAHEKMKAVADKIIAEAKQMPDAGFMKNLIHESFVTEAL